jgi:hypothetical protein
MGVGRLLYEMRVYVVMIHELMVVNVIALVSFHFIFEYVRF